MIVLGLVLVTSAAGARDRKEEEAFPSPAFKDLIACRAIEDPAARLACYDAKVATVQQATDSGDLVIADKEQMREARRGLFGFKLPTLRLFGHHGNADATDDEVSEIEGVVASASNAGYGQWRFKLEDGATWQQIDTEVLAIDPHKGSKIRIKRAAMGSYKANIDGQPAIRVRRVE